MWLQTLSAGCGTGRIRTPEAGSLGFDAEALFIARKLGFEIREVPVRWNDVAGSKVSMLSGARGFVDLVRVRLNDLRGIYKV